LIIAAKFKWISGKITIDFVSIRPITNVKVNGGYTGGPRRPACSIAAQRASRINLAT